MRSAVRLDSRVGEARLHVGNFRRWSRRWTQLASAVITICAQLRQIVFIDECEVVEVTLFACHGGEGALKDWRFLGSLREELWVHIGDIAGLACRGHIRWVDLLHVERFKVDLTEEGVLLYLIDSTFTATDTISRLFKS